jgi:hypothetical protein
MIEVTFGTLLAPQVQASLRVLVKEGKIPFDTRYRVSKIIRKLEEASKDATKAKEAMDAGHILEVDGKPVPARNSLGEIVPGSFQVRDQDAYNAALIEVAQTKLVIDGVAPLRLSELEHSALTAEDLAALYWLIDDVP